MSPSAASERLPPSTLSAALLMALIAAALRFWQAGESLWIDELHSAWCAGGTLAEVAPRATSGNQSPLFFWLLWLLVQWFGASEWTLRLPSLIAGSLLPLAVAGLVWRWTRSSAASLTAAALATVDHLLIFYATEARPYALVQFFAVLHIALTAELIERPLPRLRAAWIGLAALLFHLHYTVALLFVAELAFWCLARFADPQAGRQRLAAAATDVALVAALCLPAAFNLSAIFARRENWAAFVHDDPLWRVTEWFPWSLLAPLALAGAVFSAKHRRLTALALAWLFVPALIAWLATTFDVTRLFFPRYLIATAPAAIVLAAICVVLAPWRSSQMLLGGLLVFVAIGESGIVEQLRTDGRVLADRNEDWRGAVHWLNGQLPKHPYPVYVASGLIEASVLQKGRNDALSDYCLFPVTSLYKLSAPRRDLTPLPLYDRKQLQPARERGGAWLIVRGSPRSAERLAKSLGFRVQGSERKAESSKKSFGNIQAILLTSDHRPPTTTPPDFRPLTSLLSAEP